MHPYRSLPDDLIFGVPHALTCFARLPQMANDCDCEVTVRRRPQRAMPPPAVPEPRPRGPSRASSVLAVVTLAMFVLFFCVADAHAPRGAVVVLALMLPMVIAGNVLHLRDRP